MTESLRKHIEAVEQARRDRETELLILLLLLLGRTQRDVITAYRHVFDPMLVIANTVQGNPSRGQFGIIKGVSETMALSHQDGFTLAMTFAGVDQPPEPPDIETLARAYEPQGNAMADAITRQAQSVVADAIANATARNDTMAETAKSIREAFDTIGYSRKNPTNLESGVERAVVTASNVGVMDAAQTLKKIAADSAIPTVETITGFRHVSVIDQVTTNICMARDGLELPVDDDYWKSNFPPLHPHCRSIILPVTGPIALFKNPLGGQMEYANIAALPPVMPGFGQIPWFVLMGQ